jgi:chemotaxis protein methyltransferase CheR
MTGADFAFLAQMLLDRCALALEPGKEYLAESRLGPVARRHGMVSAAEVVRRLREGAPPALITEVVEAMVTTETSFFRDIHPFEALRKSVIPELMRHRAGQRRLNLWCAASSSGQEPYSLALLLKEHFPELAGWSVSILATDISEAMLERCRQARYSQLEVNRGLPIALLLKYFTQEGAYWTLRPEVRAMVDFRQMNLAASWPSLPPMDLILMRNVLIYFNVETKKAILGRIARTLRPDGYLALGGAETTLGLDSSFRWVEGLKAGFYQLVSA